METQEWYSKGQNQNVKRETNHQSTESSRYISVKNQNQREVRGIQYQQNPARENYYRRPRRNNYDYRPQRRNRYEVEEDNYIRNTRSEGIPTESTAMSPNLYDKRYSGN
jgi:hypothetical protein